MGQILEDVKYEDIKKGDYAFIKIHRDGVEDIGLLYYFDDDNSPRYLTHNALCGNPFIDKYAEEYGYKYSSVVKRTLYFHTTNLVDTLVVGIKMDSDFGEPRAVEILKDIPSNISSKMLERIQISRTIRLH